MNKKLIVGIIALFAVAFVGLTTAIPSETDVLVDIAYGVMILEGDPLDLPIGTWIGGEPDGDYVTLDEEREFMTEGGAKVIGEGEKIWCEVFSEPGYPNVCNGL